MKFTEDENFQIKEMASEYSRVLSRVMTHICEFQEQQLLKQSPKDKEGLSFEATKLEGMRKMMAEFNRFLSDAKKSAP